MAISMMDSGLMTRKVEEVSVEYKSIGVYSYANGNKYEGEVQNDKKDGRGVFEYANKDKYDGLWRDDKKDGKGNSYSNS
jgi:hypothetical protein